MKSRRSFLKFLALAPVAVAASSKVVEALTVASAVSATTAPVYMTPSRVAAAIRGIIPGLVQCDEFGRPYPFHVQCALAGYAEFRKGPLPLGGANLTDSISYLQHARISSVG